MDDATREFLFDFQKNAYTYQLDRTDKIRERISLLASLLTPLGAGELYLLLNYPHNLEDCSCIFFYLPITSAVVLLLTAVCQTLYSLGFGFDYSYPAGPTTWQQHAEDLAKYAKDVPEENVNVVNEVKVAMTAKYCEAASHNLQVNTRRTALILRGTQLSIISFVLLLLALPAFFYERAQKQPEPTNVVISEPVRIKQ